MTNATLTHYETISPSFLKYRSEAQRFLDRFMEDERGNEMPEAAIAALQQNQEQVIMDKFRGTSKCRHVEGNQYAVEQAPAMRYVYQLGLALIERITNEKMNRLDDPFSYTELSTQQGYQNFYRYLADNVWGGSIMTMAVMLHHAICHERAGKRVYSVTEPLGAKLRYTELRNLRSEDLRLPYENVYIQVPESAGLKVYNVETGWHRCVGVYITEDKSPSLAALNNIRECDGDLADHLENLKARGWRIMAVGESKGFHFEDHGITNELVGEVSALALDDALSYFRVPLYEGKSLDECLELTRLDMKAAVRNGSSESWDNMDEEWLNIFRWVMNAMLYATWTEPGENWIANKEARLLWQRVQKMPKSKKRSNLHKKLQGLNHQRRIVLGKNVVIDRNAPKSEGGEGTGSPMVVRTRVSGHWKMQPHGPNNSLRKLIWREPYWRGPEDAVISTPPHEMR